MVSLGNLGGGLVSEARDISDDGGAIVGSYTQGTSQRGFYWTAERGMVDARSFLISHGLNLTGWTITSVISISADGTSFLGSAIINGVVKGFLATGLPRPIPCATDLDDGSGLGTPDDAVDINDLLYFLAAFEAGNSNADISNPDGSNSPDGSVDISDLLYFLLRFEAGC